MDGLPMRRLRLLTVALCAGYFLVLLDVTVVNVALPSIGEELAPSGHGLAWVVDAYTVPLAALLLAAGGLGDRLGHRRIVIAGFVAFAVASAGCSLAGSLGSLAIWRALQGVAAAVMLPGTLALIADLYPEAADRARAIGTWAAIGALALPAGPLLGGALVEGIGWRSIFWINVPIVFLALTPIVALAPSISAREAGRAADLVGAGLAVAATGSAAMALIEARQDEALAAGALIGALCFGAVFGWHERRTSDPLLPLAYLRRRDVGSSLVAAGTMNFCTVGSLFLLTQLFQSVLGLDPLRTGLALLPAFLPLPLLGRPAGRLAATWGHWWTAASGLATAAIGFAVMVSVSAPDGIVGSIGLGLWGVGLGLLAPAIVGATIASLPGRSGLASGLNNTSRQVGGAFGVALFAALAGPATATGFGDAVRLILVGCALCYASAAILCLSTGRTLQRRRVEIQPSWNLDLSRTR
jgi:MFS transporter, DHA2 family, methylenomycin A resistance protein